MGRNYFGDINGRFWFAVQASDAADQFGVVGHQPEELYYYFSEDDLDAVNEQIQVLETRLGQNKAKMDKFFDEDQSYTDIRLADYLNIEEGEAKALLVIYADLELGIRIRDCILETGQCEFTAEC